MTLKQVALGVCVAPLAISTAFTGVLFYDGKSVADMQVTLQQPFSCSFCAMMTRVCRQSCSLASFLRGRQDWLTGLLSAWSCSGNVVGFNSSDDLRRSARSAHRRWFHRVNTRLQICPVSPSCNSRRHIWRPVEHVRALALLASGSYSHTPHIPVIPRQ